ncbi:hypothetical protein FB45DRAFT_1110372 [Roridomyces roridus]|uniref:Uncharacterized protein n=1 Tax=Roridomyces roridus TaxID=1738132 RepID=A0AAD7B9X4_9AGAR|nr:hypothetical protein FB45DRAFT_1110372 [Roridomyces roridus]
MSSSRSLSLHPSALTDAEHAFCTSTLAELLDDDSPSTSQVSISVREARAWIRGRYTALGAQTVDEIIALFAPVTTLGRGEFFAVLRLVLHAQNGQGVNRSLAFVQAPVPVTNPFLPTPTPSPESRPRPPLPPRKPVSPRFAAGTGETVSSSASSASTSSSASSAASSSLAHRYSSLSLSASNTPPALPLRRAATHTRASSASLSITPAPHGLSLQRTASNPGSGRPAQRDHNPFRSPPPPRPDAPQQQKTNHRTAPPLPRRMSSTSDGALSTFRGHLSGEPDTIVPRTAPPTTRAFPASVHTSPPLPPGRPPPLHPHRRASTESAPAFISSPLASGINKGTGTGRRVASDATPSPLSSPPTGYSAPSASLGALPIYLPKVAMPGVVRRTLAGAGWVGAERGEREGLIER